VFRPPQKNGLLWLNYNFDTIASNSTIHRFRSIALELCDQYALGLHSAHTSGNIHHASTPSPGWYAIDWLIRLSMLCSSMPPMLSPMS